MLYLGMRSVRFYPFLGMFSGYLVMLQVMLWYTTPKK